MCGLSAVEGGVIRMCVFSEGWGVWVECCWGAVEGWLGCVG